MTRLPGWMEEREDSLMDGSPPGMVSLKTVRVIHLDHFNDCWIPVDEKSSQVIPYDRLFLTI